MRETRMPPTNLDVMPPVGLNCTKKEIINVGKLSGFLAILLMLFLSILISGLGISSSGFLTFISSLILALLVSGGLGLWALKTLGKMKNTKSAKFTMQKIEIAKRFVGLHDKRVIHSAKKWSTTR